MRLKKICALAVSLLLFPCLGHAQTDGQQLMQKMAAAVEQSGSKTYAMPLDEAETKALVEYIRGCPACFLILKGVVISSHETNRFS